ncbi:MAG: 5-formyltetrahydrofolate cyclo-ligase [Nitrospinota bacterium]|nr:5-formyltetrahydrofolate cyclo-ligase [Nitrospinota bacterium]
MKKKFLTKNEARNAVWDTLQNEKVASFPFPPKGRIPNFKGSSEAAKRLLEISPWKEAKFIKINPDSPQRLVRELCLKMGKILIVPTPRLKGGFQKINPLRIPKNKFKEAATVSKGNFWSEEISLKKIPSVDAIVTGSVAVTKTGKRLGKGEGYSDLELAILIELGHPMVPIGTTIHPYQILEDFPSDSHDLSLSTIISPDATIQIENPSKNKIKIEWKKIDTKKLSEMPILRELQKLKNINI